MRSDFDYWYPICAVVAIIKGIEAYVRPPPGGGMLMAFADGMTAVVVFVAVSTILIGLWILHYSTEPLGKQIAMLYAIAVLAALIGLRQLMALANKKFGLNIDV